MTLDPTSASSLLLTDRFRTPDGRQHPAVRVALDLPVATAQTLQDLTAHVESEFASVGHVNAVVIGRRSSEVLDSYAAARGQVFVPLGPERIESDLEEIFASDAAIPRRVMAVKVVRSTLPGFATQLQVAALSTTDPRRWTLRVDRAATSAPLRRETAVEPHVWVNLFRGDVATLSYRSSDETLHVIARLTCVDGPLLDAESAVDGSVHAAEPVPTEGHDAATSRDVADAIEHLELRVDALRHGVDLEGEPRPADGHPVWTGLWQAVAAIQDLQRSQPHLAVSRALVLERVRALFGDAAHLTDRDQPTGGWWRGPSDDVVADIERHVAGREYDGDRWRDSVPLQLAQAATHNLGIGTPNGFRIWYFYAALRGPRGLADLPRDDKGINVVPALATVARTFTEHDVRIVPTTFGEAVS